MKIEGIVDRREIIEHYLRLENRKGSPIPFPYPNLPWDDVNALDCWFDKHHYKTGVISGFRHWGVAILSYEDVLDCAIVSHIFRAPSQRLGDLLRLGCLDTWKPGNPNRYWEQPVHKGESIPRQWGLIMRGALPRERARFYVEDGNGRATWFAAQRGEASRTAYAFIGFDPDPASHWLRKNLESHFYRHAQRYARLQDFLG